MKDAKKKIVIILPYYCRVENYLETTVPFSILDTNPSLLMLANKFGGIDVRTKIETSQVKRGSRNWEDSGLNPRHTKDVNS